MGKVPVAITSATVGLMCRLAMSACWAAARLVSATSLASAMEAANAAAVCGYLFSHEAVAVYPPISRP